MIIMTYVFLLPMMYSVQGNEISVHIDMNVNISKKQVTMDSDNCTSHTSPPGLWIASGVPGAPTCADFGAVQTNISGSGGQCYIFCKLQIEEKTRFFAWFWQALVDIFQQINPEPDPITSAPTTIVPTTTTTTTTTKKTTKSTSEDVTWSPIKNACIKGNNYETYQPLTIDICKEKCVEEDAINCQSIEYSSAKKMCAISDARSDSEDFIEPCHVDGWVFAEIELNADPTTGAPTTTAPSNTTTNVTSCNLVWNYEDDRPLIMIRETKTIVPPIIDIDISEDPNRIPEGKKMIFACPGENNQFNHVEGTHTKLHGECISDELFKVCLNNYPEIMELSQLSCSSQMHPSIIKQDNDTSYKKSCEDIGGELYKMGYIYGDYKEFKDLETKICFRDENQTTLWTSTNLNSIEISPSMRYKDPPNFRTAQGFAMNTFYSQKSQQKTAKEVLDKEATSVWNDKACHNHGGHCVRGGNPCPENSPHQTSQGEPFCNSFYRCCYSDQCDPTTCTYKGQKGNCSLDSLPGTTGIGSQECKKGCQCYIKDKKTLWQFKRLQDQAEFSKPSGGKCGGEENTCNFPIKRMNNTHLNLNPETRTVPGTPCTWTLSTFARSPPLILKELLDPNANIIYKIVYPVKNGIIYTFSVPDMTILQFACPAGKTSEENYLLKYSKEAVKAICYEGSIKVCNTPDFIPIGGMGCMRNIKAGVIESDDMKCGGLGTDGKKTFIGYHIDIYPFEFIKLITVCFDVYKKTTIWTSHTIHGAEMKNRLTNYGGTDWVVTDYLFEDIAIDRLYEMKTQASLYDEFFPEQRIICRNGNSKMFLARGHISPRADFITRAEQDATYNFINALPQWQVINEGNWLAIERRTQYLATFRLTDLKIFSGGSDTLQIKLPKVNKDDINEEDRFTSIPLGYWYFLGDDLPSNFEKLTKVPVPAVTWKIVIDEGVVPNEGIAFVTVNNPFFDKTKDVGYIPRCTDICSTEVETEVNWLRTDDVPISRYKDEEKGYTHCCRIADFLDKYKDIGNIIENLNNIELLANR